MTEPKEIRLHRVFFNWQRRTGAILSLLETIKTEMGTTPFRDPVNQNVCEVAKSVLDEFAKLFQRYSVWLKNLDDTIEKYEPFLLHEENKKD